MKNLSLYERPGRDPDVISHLSSSQSSDVGSFAMLLSDNNQRKCHDVYQGNESKAMNLS